MGKSERNMKVSVIIPVYNEERTIEKCLLSLLNQSYENMEIFIVDDGSTDGSVAIVRKHPVTLLQQPHSGPLVAWNRAVEESSGEILMFLGGDMVMDRECICELAGPINRGEAEGTFYRYALVANPRNTWSRCWSIEKKLPFTWHMHPNLEKESIIFRAIRKDKFTEAQGFTDVGYGGDRTLYQKLNIKARATEAICYHYNPDTIPEVFSNGLWFGRGKLLRRSFPSMVANIIKYSFPYSFLRGIKKSIQFREPFYIVFKLIYDCGVFIGLMQSNVLKTGNLSK